MGYPLVDRLGRQAQLKNAETVLYEQAVTILTAIDEAKQGNLESNDSEIGQISVGVIPTISPYLLPPPLKRFVKRIPPAQVTVHKDLTEDTIQGCLEGKLAVGVLGLPVESPHLAVEPLCTEELLLFTAAITN